MSAVKLLVFLVLLAGVCYSEGLKPLVAWSNSDVLKPQEKQLLKVSNLLERSNYDEIDQVIVFKAPLLSFDDIVKYGGVYGEDSGALGHLQSMVKVSSSSVWGGVEGEAASELEDGLRERLGVRPHYLHGSTEVAGERFVVIQLPVATDKNGFSKHDDIIAEVMRSIQDKDTTTFAAFYTTDTDTQAYIHESKRYERSTVNDGSGSGDSGEYGDDRSPSSDCEFAYSLGSNETGRCLLFCLTTNRVIVNTSSLRCNASMNEVLDAGCAANTTMTNYTMPYMMASFIMDPNDTDCTDLLGNSSFNVTFNFPKDPEVSFWNMSLEIQMDIDLEAKVYVRDGSANLNYPFAVPFDTSYSCSTPSYNDYIVFNDTNDSSVFTFLGIQVQPYNVKYMSEKNPVFTSKYDCQGYFTEASWMGIFTVLLLLLVFYLSSVCVFSIQTLDRFDDPRGATISVENLH